MGLGIDCTCTGVEVPHPTDATAPDLPPQPVLLVRRVLQWLGGGCRGVVALGECVGREARACSVHARQAEQGTMVHA